MVSGAGRSWLTNFSGMCQQMQIEDFLTSEVLFCICLALLGSVNRQDCGSISTMCLTDVIEFDEMTPALSCHPALVASSERKRSGEAQPVYFTGNRKYAKLRHTGKSSQKSLFCAQYSDCCHVVRVSPRFSAIVRVLRLP